MILTADRSGERADAALARLCPDLTRSAAQKLLESGAVTCNGRPVKKNEKLQAGNVLELELPQVQEVDLQPENIPLDVVYEDGDVIVINKPKGLVVHPAAGHWSGTLVNALMYHCRDSLSGINGELRPGIVHRIDMDTSGLLIVAKNDFAHQALAEQLKNHSLARTYECIVVGGIKADSGTIDAPIGRHPVDRKKMAIVHSGGKEAVTHYRVLERLKGYTYVECRLETGRTHQIRVHMTSIGHPLLGDEIYGNVKSPFKLQGQTLHAMVLGFIHPTTGAYMEYEAELPGYFAHLLDVLRG